MGKYFLPSMFFLVTIHCFGIVDPLIMHKMFGRPSPRPNNPVVEAMQVQQGQMSDEGVAQKVSRVIKALKTLFLSMPITRESLYSYFDPSSLKNYLLLRPEVIKFLYHNNFITKEDLRKLGGESTVGLTKIASQYGKPNTIIDKLLNTPYAQTQREYYGHNLLVQGATAGLALGSLGGLHYYHQWPLRAMEELWSHFNAVSDFKITPLMLLSIKNSIVFWNYILADLGHRVALKDTLSALEKVVMSSNRNEMHALLFFAIKRLQLMHGVWKYTPAGFYRKAEEFAGDTYDYLSGYQPMLKNAVDWTKKRIIGEPKE